MDVQNPSALPTAASRAPLHVGRVGLVVRDLQTLARYYRELLGLTEISRRDDGVTLGTGDTPLLDLTRRTGALPDDPREAGLYHTAFLMPTRSDLGRWLLHIARVRIPVTGASDHEVSEAIYLDDPEGNGIEVYVDRPAEQWRREDGMIRMVTEQLDLESLAASADGASYDGAPLGLRVGHVHLRVGDVDRAEAFYRDLLGMTVTRRRHGATFLSTGGYHHHLAGNIWHSNGAGQRNPDRTGLDVVTLHARTGEDLAAAKARFAAGGTAIQEIEDGFEVADPWGTRIRIRPEA